MIGLAPFRLWIYNMETRGVEPLSKNNATQASMGVVPVWLSPEQRPVTIKNTSSVLALYV
ncbi:hypothetical protein ACVLD2_003761 [Paenibacillus sp. PvR052]|nr:hypothetical protein [Paenibacillus sp. PvP091]MBP1171618.1 hypothetical protein [Paenibacillus sp. PvR098]MBP2437999.1 hypothetical protein [Paenibacillus sp. PvP052]